LLAGAGVGEALLSESVIALSDNNVQIVGTLIGPVLMTLAPVIFRYWKLRALPLYAFWGDINGCLTPQSQIHV
jgi:hypothetical protein